MENACVYNKTFDIIPISYRTHSHNLVKKISSQKFVYFDYKMIFFDMKGIVTSGYVIRNNEWIELGRMSPKQPQV